MSNLNRISNRIVQLAKVPPITGAATYLSLDNSNATFFVNFTEQLELLAYIHAGVVGTSIDAKWQQATDATGAGAKDLTVTTDASITQITTLNEVAQLELRQEQANEVLDLANGFKFIGLSVTTVGATTAVSAEIFGGVYAADEDGAGPQSNDQAAGNTTRQVIA